MSSNNGDILIVDAREKGKQDGIASRFDPPFPDPYLNDHQRANEEYGAAFEASRPGSRKRTSTNGQDDFEPHAVSICVADVVAESVEWLWPGRLAYGKMTLLSGDPGLGKSFASLDIAARLSRGGDWPDAPGVKIEAADVLILSSEDAPGDTIRPRLDEAQADVNRVHILTGIRKEREGEPLYPSLDVDLRHIQKLIVEKAVKLMILDPISAYLGDRDSYKNAEIRGLLGPLTDMAARTGCAVLAITHNTKAGDKKALYRAQGSIAFTAASRSAFVMGVDQDDDTLRLILSVKSNLGPEPPGIGFRIVDGAVAWDDKPVTVSADTALGRGGSEDRGTVDEAVEFLESQLLTGAVTTGALKSAADAYGHAWRTVERAKDRLGVQTSRKPGPGKTQWQWELSKEQFVD